MSATAPHARRHAHHEARPWARGSDRDSGLGECKRTSCDYIVPLSLYGLCWVSW